VNVGPIGSTRVAAVIGTPVRHSLSPVILNAAFQTIELDWVYVALEVAEGDAPAAIAGVRALGIQGLSVTMPHKSAVVALVDRLTPDAQALGAVNCVYREGGQLVGDNTDGPGFVDALRAEGVSPAGLRCVVVGAGGAGRAITRALARAGAVDVAVLNRSEDKGRVAAALAGEVGRLGREDDVRAADLVVNATPLGMGTVVGTDRAHEPLPVDASLLRAGQVVVDAVYHPPVTPLLAAASEVGAVAVGGLGMLIHQAAHAFRRWTAHDPPLEAMSAAAVAAMATRSEAPRNS
jgi:shikimate dehydrogenase